MKVADESIVKITPLLETGAVSKDGTGDLYTKMSLNEYSDEDKAIIQAKDRELTLNVKFADGNLLVRPTTLPDPDDSAK